VASECDRTRKGGTASRARRACCLSRGGNDRVGILLPVVEGGAGVEAGRLKVFAGQDAGGVVVAMPAGASRRARVLPAG
jgi:hypothetical protein